MKTYLKIKRAIRYLFYKHISVEDQLKVKEQFNNDDLTRLFWQLSMQDRHHSIEVLERTINRTLDDEILSLKELESLNDLYTLCLLHDIGKCVEILKISCFSVWGLRVEISVRSWVTGYLNT